MSHEGAAKVACLFFLGAGAASLAGLVTHPADVVKTRLQVGDCLARCCRQRQWARQGADIACLRGLVTRV